MYLAATRSGTRTGVMATITILWLLSAIVIPSWAQREASAEKALMDALLTNYNPAARPVISPHHTVDVYVGLAFTWINGVGTEEQSMTAHAIARLAWTDPFLTWNRSEFSEIESVFLPQDSIWTPDVVVLNSMASGLDPIHTEKAKVLVEHNGSVTWMPSGMFRFSCDIKITFFPFDKQECRIAVSTNAYESSTVRLHRTSEPRSSYRDSEDAIRDTSQWEVLGESSSDSTTRNGARDIVFFHIHVRRRSHYFVMNVLFPSFLLAVLNIVILLIPHSLSDKVAVSTTLVLAYVIFLIQVTDSTPANSDEIPFVTIILLVMLSISAVDVAINVLLLECLGMAKSLPPPTWLLRITRNQKCSPNSAGETSAAQTPAKVGMDTDSGAQRQVDKSEQLKTEWTAVIKTLEKTVMIFQTVVVLVMYTSIPCIYISQG